MENGDLVGRETELLTAPMEESAAELLADFAWEKVPRQDIRIPAGLFC